MECANIIINIVSSALTLFLMGLNIFWLVRIYQHDKKEKTISILHLFFDNNCLLKRMFNIISCETLMKIPEGTSLKFTNDEALHIYNENRTSKWEVFNAALLVTLLYNSDSLSSLGTYCGKNLNDDNYMQIIMGSSEKILNGIEEIAERIENNTIEEKIIPKNTKVQILDYIQCLYIFIVYKNNNGMYTELINLYNKWVEEIK